MCVVSHFLLETFFKKTTSIVRRSEKRTEAVWMSKKELHIDVGLDTVIFLKQTGEFKVIVVEHVTVYFLFVQFEFVL